MKPMFILMVKIQSLALKYAEGNATCRSHFKRQVHISTSSEERIDCTSGHWKWNCRENWVAMKNNTEFMCQRRIFRCRSRCRCFLHVLLQMTRSIFILREENSSWHNRDQNDYSFFFVIYYRITMTQELGIFFFTAVSVAFLHNAFRSGSLCAVYCYVKSGQMVNIKNNMDHDSSAASGMVGSSIILVSSNWIGIAVAHLQSLEVHRGNIAGWIVNCIRPCVRVWGIRRAYENERYALAPAHDGHAHAIRCAFGRHTHYMEKKRKSEYDTVILLSYLS